MLFELEEEQIEEIRDILGAIFFKYGPTNETVRLSQWLDNVVTSAQEERREFYVMGKASNM